MQDDVLTTRSSGLSAGPHVHVPASAGRARAGRFDHGLAERLHALLAPVGVRLVLWDGWSPSSIGRATAGDILVADRTALVQLVLWPDLYFGEHYATGRIDVRGDLVQTLMALGRTSTRDRIGLRDWVTLHLHHAIGQTESRDNVHYHYDLGNDFYREWLDEQLLYTCAYYPKPDMGLEEAQVAKMDLVCRKVRLRPGDRVLEAGCGWGALALHMARAYGARVTAFNLSAEQIRYARTRAAREGLSHMVEFVQADYRRAEGSFDVFISVGMLEHVGPGSYKAFGDVIRRTLDPRFGRGLLHFIGRDAPRPLNAWIRRRIFPGAHPPALSELQNDLFQRAQLSILDVENLRLHYARTLRQWRERFEQADAVIRERFGDAFTRAWRLYLAGSQAAFVVGSLQLFQIVFTPVGARPPYWQRNDYNPIAGTRA